MDTTTKAELATKVAIQHHREQVKLSILDQLSVPTTLDQLVEQIQGWRDCRMFYPMTGTPRAYMEFPVQLAPDRARALAGTAWGDGQYSNERWVYSVYCIYMRGPAKTTQGPLCRRAWTDMVQLRKRFAEKYGEMDPLIVWRRNPGLELVSKDSNHRYYQLYMRFAVPGLDLTQEFKSLFTSDGDGGMEIFQ